MSQFKNVEFKAKIQDLISVKLMCRDMSKSMEEVITQEDYFFNVPKGRLKLRFQEGYSTELIFYERADVEGPKLSSYDKCCVEDGNSMLSVLRSTLGVKGLVRKVRYLFFIDHARVHIDHVNELGDFIEVEVPVKEGESIEECELTALNLMKRLGVKTDDLLSGAYVDMQLED